MRLRLLTFPLAVVLFGCTSQAQETPTSVTYSANFGLDVPAGWEVRRDLGMMRVIALSPREGSTDTFQENVNVVIDGLQPGMTWDSYAQQSLALMRQGMQAFEEVESEETTLDGHPATRWVYEHTMNGRRLRVLNYTVRVGDRAYVVTGTAPADTFERFVPTFDEVARSLSVG